VAHRMLSFNRKTGLTHRISVRDHAKPQAGIALHFSATTIASAAGSRNSGFCRKQQSAAVQQTQYQLIRRPQRARLPCNAIGSAMACPFGFVSKSIQSTTLMVAVGRDNNEYALAASFLLSAFACWRTGRHPLCRRDLFLSRTFSRTDQRLFHPDNGNMRFDVCNRVGTDALLDRSAFRHAAR